MRKIGDEVIFEGFEELRVAYNLESISQVRYWLKNDMLPHYRVGATACSTERLRDAWLADQNQQALMRYKEQVRRRELKSGRNPKSERRLTAAAMGT